LKKEKLKNLCKLLQWKEKEGYWKERERETRTDREWRVITPFTAFFTDCPLTHLNSYGTHKQDVQPPKDLGSIKTQMQTEQKVNK